MSVVILSPFMLESGLEIREHGCRGSAALTMRDPLYPQRFELSSPTSGGHSIGIVRSRTKATELLFITYVRK
jgi:hypothetical protein